MLKRKMKGVATDSSPSYKQARSRFNPQTLIQDCNYLLKETEEKKRKLHLAKRRRRILLAEVGFLRQRYEELMVYQTREQHVARTQIPPESRRDTPPTRRERDRDAATRRDTDAGLPNSAPVLDLNQMANEEEEENEIPDALEMVRMEKNPMKFLISKGGKPPLPPRQQQKDLNLSVCRDIRKGSLPSKSGKRKISLQDPVALRV